MPRQIEQYFPSDKFDYVPICVFRTHERMKGGKIVKVGRQDLQMTADNHNQLWEKFARASPISMGHTLDEGPDGAEVNESDQPDTAGALVRFYVDKLPEEPEADFLFATWCRPKSQKEELSKFKSVSPEYYPNRHLIYPASLLKSNCPELVDMPALPLHYAVEDESYKITIPNPFRYTREPDMPFEKAEDTEKKPFDKAAPEKEKSEKKDDKPKSDKPEDKEMDKASKANEKGSVQDASDIADLKAQFMQFLPLLQWLQELKDSEDAGGEGKEDDLMDPADKTDPAAGKDAPVPAEKDSMKEMGNNPVKFETSMPSSTNTSIPSFEKDKEKFKVSKDNEVAKYKAELDAAKAESAAAMKIAKDLHAKNRLSEAKELVADIETVCKYRTDKARQEDLDMLAQLDEKVAKQYVSMAKERYERKLPDSKSVEEAVKYAVDKEPDLTAKTPEEAHERAMSIIKSGLTREEYYKQMAQGKK